MFKDSRYLFLSTGVEEVKQADDVAMIESTHDLQLPVLKPFILQDLLDGHHLPRLTQLGLIHNTKTAITNNLETRGQ